jgi:hypothetical protein
MENLKEKVSAVGKISAQLEFRENETERLFERKKQRHVLEGFGRRLPPPRTHRDVHGDDPQLRLRNLRAEHHAAVGVEELGEELWRAWKE